MSDFLYTILRGMILGGIVGIIVSVVKLIKGKKSESENEDKAIDVKYRSVQPQPPAQPVRPAPTISDTKIVCPFCYREFKADKVRFRFNVMDRVIYLSAGNDDDRSRAFLTTARLKKEVTTDENGIPVSMVLYRENGERMAMSPVRVCANENCNNELSRSAGTYSPDSGIFLLGLKSSGKTVFITSVIDTLSRVIPFRYKGCQFVAYNKTVDESYYSDYYKIMFEEKALPAATINPAQLIYEVKNPISNKAVGITFSDIKGEISDSTEEIFNGEVQGALLHSNYFILTIDLKDIRENRSHQRKNLWIINHVLSKVTADPTQKDRKYLAVVITKSDELIGTEDGAFNINSPVYNANITSEGEAFNEERERINSLLRDYLMSDVDCAQIVSAAESEFLYGHINYFAVSALGQAPVNGKLETEIKPIRVEEPILWLLKKSGVI